MRVRVVFKMINRKEKFGENFQSHLTGGRLRLNI